MSKEQQAWMDAMSDIMVEEAQKLADKMIDEIREEDYRNDRNQ